MSEDVEDPKEWVPCDCVVVLDIGAGRGRRKPFIRLLVTVKDAQCKQSAIGRATSLVMTDPVGSQLWWGWSIVPARVLPLDHETLNRHGEYLTYTIPIKGSTVTYVQGPKLYDYGMVHGGVRDLVVGMLPASTDVD